MSALSTQILFFVYDILARTEQSSLEICVQTRLGKRSLGYIVVLESQEVLNNL